LQGLQSLKSSAPQFNDVPAFKPIQRSKVQVDRGAADRDDTIEAVVLAANGVRSAGAAADTNDGDGRAGNADLGSGAAKNNAEQAQQDRSDRVAGRLNTVAALERTDIALTDSNGRGRRGGRDGNGLRRVVQDHRRGDRKEWESQCSSDSGELHFFGLEVCFVKSGR